MKISRVGVLGAGLMGSGIAEVCAKAGYETIVREVSDELARKGVGRVESSLAKAVERGKLAAADRDAARGLLTATTRVQDLEKCDLVIEAVVENLPAKKELFGELD
ncbi:MAG TPA: 3-hydroxyacyl-CoA dehydrogenase NAD-binding domain-containing protein, partial [Thermoanaerobaculia bacterium]